MFLKGKTLRMVASKSHGATPVLADNGRQFAIAARALGMSGAINDNQPMARVAP